MMMLQYGRGRPTKRKSFLSRVFAMLRTRRICSHTSKSAHSHYVCRLRATFIALSSSASEQASSSTTKHKMPCCCCCEQQKGRQCRGMRSMAITFFFFSKLKEINANTSHTSWLDDGCSSREFKSNIQWTLNHGFMDCNQSFRALWRMLFAFRVCIYGRDGGRVKWSNKNDAT